MEVLAEDLAGAGGEPGAGTEEDRPPDRDADLAPAVGAPSRCASRPQARSDAGRPGAAAGSAGQGLPAEEVRRCVVGLQEAFGARIERILASRGGLLVVLDHIDEAADRLAGSLSERVPIALIDRRTLAGLQRLGAASPVEQGETLFEAAAEPASRAVHPLARQAQAKLRGQGTARPDAGRRRLGGPAPGPAARRPALRRRPPDRSRPSPQPPRGRHLALRRGPATGAIDPTDAALVMRAIALAQGADAVPPALLQELAGRYRALGAAELPSWLEMGNHPRTAAKPRPARNA